MGGVQPELVRSKPWQHTSHIVLQLSEEAKPVSSIIPRCVQGQREHLARRLNLVVVIDGGLDHRATCPRRDFDRAEAYRFLSELINRPGTVWDGATGSGMNWRLALSELEAERSYLRLDSEPVILYSRLSSPGQAYANLLRELYCLDAVITVSLEWRPWAVEAARRRIRGAQRHYFAKRYSMIAHVQETEGYGGP